MLASSTRCTNSREPTATPGSPSAPAASDAAARSAAMVFPLARGDRARYRHQHRARRSNAPTTSHEIALKYQCSAIPITEIIRNPPPGSRALLIKREASGTLSISRQSILSMFLIRKFIISGFSDHFTRNPFAGIPCRVIVTNGHYQSQIPPLAKAANEKDHRSTRRRLS